MTVLRGVGETLPPGDRPTPQMWTELLVRLFEQHPDVNPVTVRLNIHYLAGNSIYLHVEGRSHVQEPWIR